MAAWDISTALREPRTVERLVTGRPGKDKMREPRYRAS